MIMNSRKALTMEMPLNEIIYTMCEGNPGAATIIAQLLPRMDAMYILWLLDDMGMRGSQIWIAYSDFALRELEKFIADVKTRDFEMRHFVDLVCCPQGKAKTKHSGASGIKFI